MNSSVLQSSLSAALFSQPLMFNIMYGCDLKFTYIHYRHECHDKIAFSRLFISKNDCTTFVLYLKNKKTKNLEHKFNSF